MQALISILTKSANRPIPLLVLMSKAAALGVVFAVSAYYTDYAIGQFMLGWNAATGS